MASDNQGWQDFTIQGSNEDEKLSAYYWPTDNPRGLLVIVHGLAEHAGRYDAFARYMNQRKIAVAAYDQRGHGRTAANGGKHGFVAPRQTTNILLADINRAIAWARQLVPGAPLVLMGHSMGSLLVRVALADPGLNESCKAAIFSGTAGHPGIAGRAGVLLAGLISLFRGPSHPSRLIDSMVFGAYAAKFSPVRTGFDWLSRDEAMVDAYIADPWCGFTASASLFKSLISVSMRANTERSIRQIHQDLPILCFAGDHDPVGDFGSGVHKVVQMHRAAGARNLTLQLYAEGRHEMLNETNRLQVYTDIADWILQLV